MTYWYELFFLFIFFELYDYALILKAKFNPVLLGLRFIVPDSFLTHIWLHVKLQYPFTPGSVWQAKSGNWAILYKILQFIFNFTLM